MTLYLVGTPIGNLGDITLRALEVLKNTPVVAVEKWTDTRKLFDHFGIKPEKIVNYDDKNKLKTAPKIIEILKTQDVALVTSAGMPGVSDPGGYLVRKCREAGIAVVPIPGASALTAAIAGSGFVGEFLFVGFSPRKAGQIGHLLERASAQKANLVFYESTYRVEKTLRQLEENYPETPIFLGKEMTKMFEHYLVGTAGELLERIAADKNFSKGEFTVIVNFA